jgi:tetratricopeptide (TPR) repeat protein
LQDRHQHVWYPRLEREQDNLRAALTWLLQTGDAESALRLCGAVWRFWQRRGDVREGRRWLEESLALAKDAPADVRARALWGASWLAYYQGDHARTRALSAEHLALALEQGNPLSTRNALTGLGMAAIAEGRYQEAISSLQQALDVCMPLGDIWHRATSYLNLGTACLLAGDLERATVLLDEALAQYRERGDEVFAARVVQHLGYVALLRGDLGQSRALYIESLQALYDLGENPGVADGLEAVAALTATTGDPEGAGRLVGAAARLREEIGVMPLPALRTLWHPVVARAEQALGKDRWTAAWDEGQSMPLGEAVARAASDTT